MGRPHKHKSLDFSVIDTEEKAYILGFLGADGCMYYSKTAGYVIALSLKKDDLDMVEKIRDIITPTRKVYVQKRERGNMAILSIQDQVLYSQLLKHNLTPRKTFTLKPPDNIPSELVGHYIRGLFDGDGTIYSTKKHRLQCGIVGSLGIISFVHKEFSKLQRNNSNIYKEKSVYVIKYSALNALLFLQWVYSGATIYMERKHNIAKIFLQEEASRIFRREWTEADFSILRKNYPTRTREEIMALLPDFSWSAISLKASRLKISRGNKGLKKPRFIWTPERIDTLKTLYYKYGEVALLQDFFPNITYTTLRRMCKKLNLY